MQVDPHVPATATTAILTNRTVFQAEEAWLTVTAPMFQKPVTTRTA